LDLGSREDTRFGVGVSDMPLDTKTTWMERVLQTTPAGLALRAASIVHRVLYRASGGKLGGSIRGAPVLLLTVRGRRSGKPVTLPLLYVVDGDRLVVVASKGGHPRHPAWFLNLVANPDVEVERGRSRERRRARVATAEERFRLWPRAVELYPSYAGYQARTSREIPLVVLEPP
jgi:deazaflavin-dependent oxidoreductase (nitroreductase family)